MVDDPQSTLRLDTVTNTTETVIIVRGDVDAGTAPQLEAVVDSLAEDTAVVELDLSELRFLDSTGLGVVAATVRRLETVRGELRLSHVPPMVHRLLEITDLLRFVTITSTRS